MPIRFESERLTIAEFEVGDVEDLFDCISPAITVFMPWEPPHSIDELKARRQELASAASSDDFMFVIRNKETAECLGATSIHGAGAATPEVGIWLRQSAQGFGYASETIKRLCVWATETFDPQGFIYPVAVENLRSRRIAERLGGVVVAHRINPKYASVVYRIPRPA